MCVGLGIALGVNHYTTTMMVALHVFEEVNRVAKTKNPEIAISKDVVAFATMMQEELDKHNETKGRDGWRNQSARNLYLMMSRYFGNLGQAFYDLDHSYSADEWAKIQKLATDVANFAMFIGLQAKGQVDMYAPLSGASIGVVDPGIPMPPDVAPLDVTAGDDEPAVPSPWRSRQTTTTGRMAFTRSNISVEQPDGTYEQIGAAENINFHVTNNMAVRQETVTEGPDPTNQPSLGF